MEPTCRPGWPTIRISARAQGQKAAAGCRCTPLAKDAAKSCETCANVSAAAPAGCAAGAICSDDARATSEIDLV